jgi:hypothetical protein
MSNDIINYDDEMAKEAREAAAAEKPISARISTKGGILKYNKNELPGNVLECIIVTDRHARKYFEKEFDPNELENPVCWSYSPDGKFVGPHPEASKPQSDNCLNCWANKFETAHKGAGKACSERRVLAVAPSGVSAEDARTADLATLELTPTTSREDYPKYVKGLSIVHGLSPAAAITSIGTKPDAKSQYRLTFAAGNQAFVKGVEGAALKVDPHVWAALKERREEAVQMIEVAYEPNPELTEEQIMAKEAEKEAKAARGKKLGGGR